MSRRFLEFVLDANTEKNRVEVRVREKDKGRIGKNGVKGRKVPGGGSGAEAVDKVGGISLALKNGEGETVELGEV